MKTTLTEQQREQLAPVFEESDKRYAPVSTVENLRREIADWKSAPVFISQETRQRGNTIPELSLGRLTSAFIKKRIDGDFPGGKEFSAEVDYLRRAFTSGTTTQGGFLIPEDWENLVIQELGAK